MSDKVPTLHTLERSLSKFNKKSLQSKEARYELLDQLKSTLMFIRDYDKPPPDIIQKETEYYSFFTTNPGHDISYPEAANYSPTINHCIQGRHYTFQDER